MRSKDKLIAIIIIIGLFAGYSSSPVFMETGATKSVLFLNSYHEGYKWSDDVLDGIKSELHSDKMNFDLQIEYMDTQRTNDPEYIPELKYDFIVRISTNI